MWAHYFPPLPFYVAPSPHSTINIHSLMEPDPLTQRDTVADVWATLTWSPHVSGPSPADLSQRRLIPRGSPSTLPSTGTADRRRNASGSTTQCLACRKLAAGKRLGLRPFRAAVGGSSSSAPVGCSVKHRGCPFEFLVHKKFDVQLCWTDQ